MALQIAMLTEIMTQCWIDHHVTVYIHSFSPQDELYNFDPLTFHLVSSGQILNLSNILVYKQIPVKTHDMSISLSCTSRLVLINT